MTVLMTARMTVRISRVYRKDIVLLLYGYGARYARILPLFVPSTSERTAKGAEAPLPPPKVTRS